MKLIGENYEGVTGEDGSISTLIGPTQTLTLVGTGVSATAITGLSTNNQYQVLNLDKDKFRLCYSGIATTRTPDKTNYNNKEVCCMSFRHAQMNFHNMYADQEAYYLVRGKD